MSKGNTFENDILKLFFHGTPIANLADNATSSPLTDLYVSLHTADPGEAGTMATNEATYTGYARVAVPRSVAGWTITGNQVENAALVQFPQCTGGTNAITHASVGVASAGAVKVMYKGALGATLNVTNGIQPQFAAGDIDVSED